MPESSAGAGQAIDRRSVMQRGLALAAIGPALLNARSAEARNDAQPSTSRPVIIDSQVHAYAANTPDRPWRIVPPTWPSHATGDEMVAAMDRLGIGGAINIPPSFLYGYDASYAIEVQRAYPGRFAMVKVVDPENPAVAEIIAAWRNTPGAVGIRIEMPRELNRAPDDPGLRRIMRAAAQHGFPVNVFCWGNLDGAAALIDRYPDTRFIIDHLGLPQPSTPPPPLQPWAELPKVLDLARYENAMIKITGACTLSRQPYPFADIWDPLARIFDAWGFSRSLWGSDWTRTFGVINYRQAIEPFLITDRLNDRERAMLMGEATAQAYSWRPNA